MLVLLKFLDFDGFRFFGIFFFWVFCVFKLLKMEYLKMCEGVFFLFRLMFVFLMMVVILNL